MSWATGSLLGFDLEATGVDPLTALPVSFALVRFDAGQVSSRRYGLVDPGVPIPEDSIAIHHITDEMVRERGGTLENSVTGLVGALVFAATEGVPVVAMNASYDLTVLDSCYRRFNGIGLREAGWNGSVIDPLVIDRAMDKYRKGSRRLVNLCETYGVNLANAHHAGADAEAAVMVALALAKRYPTQVGNVDAELLTVQQAAWRRAWVKDFSEYRVKNGEEPLPLEEGHWPLATDERTVPV